MRVIFDDLCYLNAYNGEVQLGSDWKDKGTDEESLIEVEWELEKNE